MGVTEVALTLAGAGIGSVLRYWLGGWIGYRMGPGFPWGTLTINLIGSMELGFLYGLAPQDKSLIFILGSGVIAGFTTFSTFMLETANLTLAEEHDRVLMNVFGSVVLGILALFIGFYTGANI